MHFGSDPIDTIVSCTPINIALIILERATCEILNSGSMMNNLNQMQILIRNIIRNIRSFSEKVLAIIYY